MLLRSQVPRLEFGCQASTRTPVKVRYKSANRKLSPEELPNAFKICGADIPYRQEHQASSQTIA